jgi:hypothetical protein
MISENDLDCRDKWKQQPNERLQPDRQYESGRLRLRDAFVHHLVWLVATVSLSDVVERRGPAGERNEHPFHFVLNDEALTLMTIVQMIEDLGHQVAAEGGSISEASVLAETADFDPALLEVNIRGDASDDVA